MKTYFFILLSFIYIDLTAQIKEKDTLFFNVDKYYTISPSIKHTVDETYYNKLAFEKMQPRQTRTDGYIFFDTDTVLKGIKPKKIISIKEYIENKKFYYDGNHNKIIDKWKLMDSLTGKYVIFFVNGNELIRSKNLQYISYYPIHKDTKVIQNKRKDTLFFKLDNNYMYEHESVCNPKRYTLKDSEKSNTGIFYFEEFEEQSRPKFKSKKILDLENFVHSTRFYNTDKQTIQDCDLSEYFNNYVIFLDKEIKNKHDYIQIKSFVTIE